MNFNAPMCLACKRYDPETGACEAYPGGVPEEIIVGNWDHRFPKPGDRGLRFDPKPGSPTMDYWPDERTLRT